MKPVAKGSPKTRANSPNRTPVVSRGSNATARSEREIRLPAIEIRQGPNRLLYSFAVDGKVLHQFATVSRVHRSDEQQIQGYQRPDALIVNQRQQTQVDKQRRQ